MKFQFGEIINEVLMFYNQEQSDANSAVLSSIRRRINMSQDYVTFYKSFEWRKRTYYLTTRAPYTTGTVTVTEGSRTVTGSGTTWTADMVYGYFKLGSVAYKILSVDSTTSLKLEAPYPKDTASAQTYSLVFPDYPLNHEITSILSIKIEGRDLDVCGKDQLVYSPASTGTPVRASFGERSRYHFFNTGTASVTNASAVVTITGATDLPENIEGFTFRINEFSKDYTIKTRDSGSQLTLTENYQGTTGSGKSYVVNPIGTSMLSFRNTPDDRYHMEIEALVSSPKLIDDTDYSFIPEHTALMMVSIWLAALDMKEKSTVRIQQARSDAERALLQMCEMYRSIGNVKWTTADEINAKKNITGLFNPLERR